GAEAPPEARAADRVAIQRIIAEAFVAAFRWMALVAAGLALASAVTPAVMIDGGLPGASGSGRGASAGRGSRARVLDTATSNAPAWGARGARARRSRKEASQHAALDRRRHRAPARRQRRARRGSLALDGCRGAHPLLEPGEQAAGECRAGPHPAQDMSA